MTGAQQAERLEGYGVGVGRTIGMVLLLAALGGVLWVWFGMVKLDRWPIRWLEVDGAFERVSAEQVRKAAAPLVDGSFFTVNPGAIRDAARELHWVDEVIVEKTWPDTVRLYVTEYVPVAHWNDGRLIATNGDTFAVPGADAIQGLPWLEGPEDRVTHVIETWLTFSDILVPTGQEIARIRLDRRGAWNLELAGGTKIAIGREDATPRLQRMAQSWAALRALRDTMPRRIDLRYSNGFAVEWPDAVLPGPGDDVARQVADRRATVAGSGQVAP